MSRDEAERAKVEAERARTTQAIAAFSALAERLDAARALGHIDENRANPARWRGHLDKLLPNPKKIGERGHHATMPYADVPTFMATLRSAPGTAAKALMFTILTAARTTEALGMTWDEIDLDAKTWTVPARRMKASKAHRVPLSARALDILRDQMAARGRNPHVFPGLPKLPLSNMAMAQVMRRHGQFDPLRMFGPWPRAGTVA